MYLTSKLNDLNDVIKYTLLVFVFPSAIIIAVLLHMLTELPTCVQM